VLSAISRPGAGRCFAGADQPWRLTDAIEILDLLSDWEFAREPDALTGYDELVVLAARSKHPAGF